MPAEVADYPACGARRDKKPVRINMMETIVTAP